MSVEFPKSKFDLKVVGGGDGWLFLDNDKNDVMLQHAGKLRLSEEQLVRWRFTLESRIAWLEKRDIRYWFLVAPNPHSVFPEKLPDGAGSGERRPVLQLLRHLRERSYARIVYPIEDLVAEKHRCVYAKTNSHWTDFGAFIAYRCLMAEVSQSVAASVLTEEDLQFVELSKVGDLGAKLVPPESSLEAHVIPCNGRAEIVFDNRIHNTGRRIDYICDTAPPTTCLIFGDSFAHMLLPFLAESFGRLVFGHLASLDHTLVEEVRPDIVVSVLNERFLVQVPNDLDGENLAHHEAAKRADGYVYPPRSMSGNRVDSMSVDALERDRRDVIS